MSSFTSTLTNNRDINKSQTHSKQMNMTLPAWHHLLKSLEILKQNKSKKLFIVTHYNVKKKYPSSRHQMSTRNMKKNNDLKT